jgi:hypothetical protein
MRISFSIRAYYDWFEAPKGTEITEEDVTAGLAKEMSDGKWYLRVEKQAEPHQHHDVGLHEAAIADRMAGLVACGKPASRGKVALELLSHSTQHHLEDEHITGVEVHDDGPDPELYRAALVERGVAEARLDKLVAGYARATKVADKIKAAHAAEAE